MDVNEFFLWLEGDEIMIGVPKTLHDKDLPWKATGIPGFFTGGTSLRHPERVKQPMLDNRMRYVKLKVPHDDAKLFKTVPCGRCFARMVLGRGRGACRADYA